MLLYDKKDQNCQWMALDLHCQAENNAIYIYTTKEQSWHIHRCLALQISLDVGIRLWMSPLTNNWPSRVTWTAPQTVTPPQGTLRRDHSEARIYAYA